MSHPASLGAASVSGLRIGAVRAEIIGAPRSRGRAQEPVREDVGNRARSERGSTPRLTAARAADPTEDATDTGEEENEPENFFPSLHVLLSLSTDVTVPHPNLAT
jgi:hypothetical protein